MKSTFGKIATFVLCTMLAHLAFATPSIENFVSDTLVQVGENEPQDSMGFVVGQICPSGTIITDSDLQNRCNEIAVGAVVLANDLEGARDAMQAMAPEEDAVIASTQVDSGSAQVDNVGDRLSAIRGGGGPGLVYRNNSGFNWSTGAAGDGASPWGFFVNGLYVTSDRDSTSRESGFESDDWGVTGGVDYAAVIIRDA